MKQESRYAKLLEEAIHKQGDYNHVSVRYHRSALYVYTGDDEPIARLTPIAAGEYGLHFHSHTGRWEPMPLSGKVPNLAEGIVDVLGPHLQNWN